MIRFRTFGTVELEGADGTEIRSVLAQPKRLALLAYLATAVPRGYHRRDTLFGLFWSELDADRARGALNTAVYHLRRSLGAATLVNRGDEEIGLAWDRIACDAAEFEEALEQASLEEALGLYRGDFLQGFFLSDAPAWERWLERERNRLRERARAAAWTLMERAEAAGDLEGAVHWVGRAFRVAPDDERTLRRLISTLDQRGDRAGALRVYRDFAERLAEEYGTEPAPETNALIEAVRTREEPRSAPSPVASAAIPSPSSPAASPAPRAGPAPRRRQAVRGERSRRALLAGAAALGFAGAAVWWGGRDRGAAAPAAGGGTSNVVAVLPFAIHGDSGLAYLEQGMVDLLSAKLSGAGGFRTVDPRALLSFLARTAEGAAAERGRSVARRFGAGYVIAGSVVEAGAELQLGASLYRDPGAEPVARAAAGGSVDRLPALVDDLARQLLVHLPSQAAGGLARPAGSMTASLPALKAYLAGERALRAGHYRAAADAFRRAVGADTTFALAYFGWGQAAIWTGQTDVARQAGKAVLRYAGRLSEPDRLLIRAWNLSPSAPLEAERLYRQALERHPDDVEAWYQLGDMLFHWGPLVGRPAGSAREPFERVRFFEPQHTGALIHLARIAGMEGRTAELDTLSAAILAREPDGAQALELYALRAFALGDEEARQWLRRQAAFADDPRLRVLIRAVAAYTGRVAAAAEFARTFLTPARSTSWHVFHLQAAEFEAARGRWHAARRELDALAAVNASRAAEFRAMLATLSFLAVPERELRRIRDAFPRPDGEVAIGAWLDFLPTDRIYAPRALYLLGLLSARLSDLPAAARYAAELENFRGGDARAAAFAAEFGRTLRAQLARQSGEPRRALALLGEPRVPPDTLEPTLVSYPKAHARWLRAELLRELGRDREALEWYATFPSPQTYDIMYAAAARLRRAEIHERLGEMDEAARHYARALAYWADAGPTLAPLVRTARAGLVRTRPRPPG